MCWRFDTGQYYRHYAGIILGMIGIGTKALSIIGTFEILTTQYAQLAAVFSVVSYNKSLVS